MPQATFRFPRVHSQEQVRVTSDSGGSTLVARLRADLRGQLQNLVGPDGVTTLYLQSEAGTTAVTGTVAGDGASTTQAAVDTAVAALVTGAPAALDTLDELAAALGDDANYAATVTTALAARLTTVSHGSTAGTARPTSTLPVLWIGTVAPTNRATRDLWMDETAITLKRWDGSTWVASGGSSVASSGPLTFPPQAQRTMVQTFQSGHGWTLAGSGWTWSADTTDYRYGSQSLKVISSGAGNNATATKSGLTATDLTGKVIGVLVKFDHVAALNTLYVQLGNSSFAQNRLLKVQIGTGSGAGGFAFDDDYVWLTCDVADYQSQSASFDVTAVTDWQISVYDGVPTGAVTAHVQAIGYHTKPTVYPTGVVSFTFDDSLLSQYTLGAPCFDKYGVGASAFLIADIMGRAPGAPGEFSGGRFSIDQAHELETLHGWDMGGHAFTSANHDRGMTALSPAELVAEMGGLKAFLRAEGFKAADSFAWPLGANDAATAKTLAKYFSWCRHTNGKFSPLIPNQPLRAQAVSLTSDTSLATYQGYINEAKSKGKWLVLMGHQIVASGAAGDTNVNQADVQAVVDYCIAQGVPIQTVGQVMSTVKGAPRILGGNLAAALV